MSLAQHSARPHGRPHAARGTTQPLYSVTRRLLGGNDPVLGWIEWPGLPDSPVINTERQRSMSKNCSTLSQAAATSESSSSHALKSPASRMRTPEDSRAVKQRSARSRRKSSYSRTPELYTLDAIDALDSLPLLDATGDDGT